MNNMPRINLYLDPKTETIFRELSQHENRPMSKQLKHMMEFYIKYKDVIDLPTPQYKSRDLNPPKETKSKYSLSK